jgi:hypothetical protein
MRKIDPRPSFPVPYSLYGLSSVRLSSTIMNESAKVNGLAITGPAPFGGLLTLTP